MTSLFYKKTSKFITEYVCEYVFKAKSDNFFINMCLFVLNSAQDIDPLLFEFKPKTIPFEMQYLYNVKLSSPHTNNALSG